MLAVAAVISLLILGTALYVAAEFAAVSVRRSRVRRLAEDGNTLAARLLPYVDDAHKLDEYVAVSQIGITLSSLVLGAYAQAALAPSLAPVFEARFTLDPNQAEAWLNKAVLQLRTGKAVDALPMVQRAIDLKTRRPALAYFVRAMAHEQGGNIRAAYEDLKRAQALEPGWKDPQIELRRFQVRRL